VVGFVVPDLEWRAEIATQLPRQLGGSRCASARYESLAT